MGGLFFLLPLALLLAQSIQTFNSGELISSSSINANFQIAAPEGAVVAFMLTSCPTGWINADGNNGTPDTRGRFVRGIDDFGSAPAGVDPSGTRVIGNLQDDAFQGHIHPVNGHLNVWRNFVPGAANAIPPGSVDSPQTISIGSPVSDGSNGAPRTASETRPDNVALIHCMRKDS